MVRVAGAEPAREPFSPVADGLTRPACEPTGHGLPDVVTLPVDAGDPDSLDELNRRVPLAGK